MHQMLVTAVDDWVASSNDALELALARSASDITTFRPEFTYPFFGENENIYGYKEPRLRLQFASGSLATYLDFNYKQLLTNEDGTPASAIDDVVEKVKERLPLGDVLLTSRERFLNQVQADAHTFRPVGDKFHEYTLGEHVPGEDEVVYEMYMAKFTTPKFTSYFRRMRIFNLFYIEAAEYIDEDERWEVVSIFERRKASGGEISYHLVGFCSMYPFFNFPDRIRMRVSQFLILPPFQKKGHGSILYQQLYAGFRKREEVAEMTVEDPSDDFMDLRDKNDLRLLWREKAFEGITLPVERNFVTQTRRKYKLTKRQVARCLEIYLYKHLDKTDPVQYRNFRLHVKERLYRQSEEALSTLDKKDRLDKLQEAFEAVEEDCRRVLSDAGI